MAGEPLWTSACVYTVGWKVANAYNWMEGFENPRSKCITWLYCILIMNIRLDVTVTKWRFILLCPTMVGKLGLITTQQLSRKNFFPLVRGSVVTLAYTLNNHKKENEHMHLKFCYSQQRLSKISTLLWTCHWRYKISTLQFTVYWTRTEHHSNILMEVEIPGRPRRSRIFLIPYLAHVYVKHFSWIIVIALGFYYRFALF